ncbi:MAG TPA: hypothetical protein VII06_20800 [Chloroflexota bacterium]|jgi:hypothetical protein
MRRLILLALLLLSGLTVGGAERARAQDADASATATGPITYGQLLRANGFTVSDAEMAYLDADERLETGYLLALSSIQLLAATPPDQQTDAWRQSLTGELSRIIEMDPAGTPPAPPSLQHFRDLTTEHRRHAQQAARQWLAGVQAGDAQWAQRGADEERAAGESYAAFMQELAAHFPPPADQPTPQP